MTGAALVLASTSPRRRLMLEEAGYRFEAVSPGIDDAQLAPSASVPPHLWTAALAYLKARAALERSIAPPTARVLLAADTIVVKSGRILGQPMTEADARAILASLEHGSHTVMSGVALLAGGSRLLFTDEADVNVGWIGRERIDRYVESGAWRGKAGAYNLAERLAEGWPITHTGDPATIMGLPMRRLQPMLDRLLGGGRPA